MGSSADRTPVSALESATLRVVTVTATASPRVEPTDEDPPPRVSGPTTVRTEPSVVNLAVGESHEVELWLDNVERLSSVAVDISFNSQYLRVEDADPGQDGIQVEAGELLTSSHIVRNDVDHTAGLISYQASVAGFDDSAEETPVDGGGTVAVFTVLALAEGGSPLSFRLVDLRDPEGVPLTVSEQIDGLVIVGPGGTVDGGAVDEQRAVHEGPSQPVDGAAVGDTTHIVQPGENLFRIALRYGTTVEAIVAVNHLPDSHAVQVGQVLQIPSGRLTGEAVPFTDGHYTVQPGDTLYAIARQFDTTVETLAALNGIAPPYAIEVGQVLLVVP
jgi:LysM repeat protein